MLARSQTGGEAAPRGSLRLVKFSAWPQAVSLGAVLKHGLPRPGLGREVNAWRLRNMRHLWRGFRTLFWARVFGIPTHFGALYLDKFTPHGRVPLGLASLRVVTNAGAAFIVDAFQGSVEMEDMKFHGFGTGGTAEAVGDTGLVTELTTQYASDNVRPTGTQTENGANVYETVGSLDPDAAVAITEHGVFSQAATGGGTLLDRTLFAVVNVAAAGEALQATYNFTITAGS